MQSVTAATRFGRASGSGKQGGDRGDGTETTEDSDMRTPRYQERPPTMHIDEARSISMQAQDTLGQELYSN